MEQKEVERLTKEFAQTLGFLNVEIIFRNKMKNLGYCNSINGGWDSNSITYSNRLLLKTDESIIKVIKHECLHLIYPNHRKEFHKLARLYDADVYAYSRKKRLP
jgi:predicted metal-dependent hydrolase